MLALKIWSISQPSCLHDWPTLALNGGSRLVIITHGCLFLRMNGSVRHSTARHLSSMPEHVLDMSQYRWSLSENVWYMSKEGPKGIFVARFGRFLLLGHFRPRDGHLCWVSTFFIWKNDFTMRNPYGFSSWKSRKKVKLGTRVCTRVPSEVRTSCRLVRISYTIETKK